MARKDAEYMVDPYSIRVMPEIAERYELIAKRAEIKGGSASMRKV